MIKITENQKSTKIIINLMQSIEEHKEGLHASLCEIGKLHTRSIHNLMTLPKTGLSYKIGKIIHTASAPGEAPAILTKDLYNSIEYKVTGSKEVEFGDKEMTGKASYGKYLEEGTKKIEPRPHVMKAVEKNKQETKNILIRNGIKATLGK